MSRFRFRVWDKDKNRMEYDDLGAYCNVDVGMTLCYDDCVLMQCTGLKDKNGKDIYEGDILRVRFAERESQTHEGDNIPLGSYTEPLEPVIREHIRIVSFVNGMFTTDETTPLLWDIEQSNVSEINELPEQFSGNWGLEGDWDNDLEYLLEEYDLPSAHELLEYLGTEVIGNIYGNQKLLEETT